MASIIRIKRSSTSGDPSTLGSGELAYSSLSGTQSNGGDRLYIGFGNETAGNAANHFVIGGKYFTDLLDHTHGTLTASSAIVVDSDKKIDELNVDNITLNGNTISSTNSNGNIVLDPAGTGYVEIAGTNGLVIPVGTTAQQGPAVAGAIRLNSESGQFEGYSGTNWASLGGVRSVDGLTYITAESTPGASNDTLSFVTDGDERLAIDTNSADFDSTIDVVINSTTTSTSTSSGALVVAGGVGIGGALYVSGAISADSATFDSINDTPIGNTTPSTGAFTTLAANGLVTFTDLTESTDKDSGAVVVEGGVGIEKNLNVGGAVGITGDLTVISNTIKSSTATAISLSGADVEVKGDLTITGNDVFSSSAKAITLSGADVNVLGDLDVDVNLNVDGTAQIDGATTIGASAARAAVTVYGTTVSITGSDTTTMGVEAATASAITYELKASNTVGDANLDVNVDDAFTLDATTVSIDSTDNSNVSMTANSSSTKTLAIDAANAGSGEAVIAIGSTNTDAVNITTATTGQVQVTADSAQFNVGDFTVDGTAVTITTTGTGDNVTVTSGEVTINTDSLTFRGEEGSGDDTTINVTGQLNVDNLRLDGNTLYSTDASNELYIDPAPMNDIGGTVIIKGNLQVDGTTTTVNSTTVTIDDPIFTLGGEETPIAQDNLDRGIEFKWHDGTNAKLGFFGYDDSAAEFVLIADADNTAGVLTPAALNVYGNARYGKLALVDGTASTTTTSGALTVAGGVGISGQLNVAGTTNKFTSTQASSSTTTGALVVAGGVGIDGSVYLGTNLVGAGAATSSISGFDIDGGTY